MEENCEPQGGHRDPLKSTSDVPESHDGQLRVPQRPSAAVVAAFDAAHVKIGKLPARMTGELQAMDLMVNGPLKAAFRRERSLQFFQYFQQRVAQRRALLLPAVPQAAAAPAVPAANVELPNFAPPKPSLRDGLLLCFATLRGWHPTLTSCRVCTGSS